MKSLLMSIIFSVSSFTWAKTSETSYAFSCGASKYSMPTDVGHLIELLQPQVEIDFGAGLIARLNIIDGQRMSIQVFRNEKAIHSPSIIDGRRSGQAYLFIDGIYFNCTTVKIISD